MKYVEELLGPTGALAKAIPGYSPRSTQIAMAEKVADCLETERSLAVEAKTGTGKSFAYLIPAIVFSMRHKTPVVICTANKTLQAQLIEKDLPFLAEHLPLGDHSFSYVEVKGRGNYACNKKIEQFSEVFTEKIEQLKASKIALSQNEKEDKKAFDKIWKWYKGTITGDLKELSTVPHPRLLKEITVEENECTNRSCPQHWKCFANKPREAAQEANIIVVNYSILFFDLFFKRESGDKKGLLPPYKHVVFDEAHKMLDMGREHFGFKIRKSSLQKQLGFLQKSFDTCMKYDKYNIIDPSAFMTPDPKTEFEDLCETVRKQLHRFCRELKSYMISGDYKKMLQYRDNGKIRYPTPLLKHIDTLHNIGLSINAGVERTWSGIEDGSIEGSDKVQALFKDMNTGLGRTLTNMHKFYKDIKEEVFGSIIQNKNWKFHDKCAYLVPEPSKDHKFAEMVVVPFDIAPLLQKYVFSQLKSSIATSATIEAKGGFDFFFKYTGFEGDQLCLPSEFDLKSQMEVILAKNAYPVPNKDPKEKERYYNWLVDDALKRIVEHHKGGVLILTTSKEHVNVISTRLSKATEHRIISQYESPQASKVLDKFRKDADSSLVGTMSLWEGIDVPGHSCRVVVICKNPFKHMEDPVINMMQARGDQGWFSDYMLPLAVITFKQGIGRLIRNETDKGVIYLLDSRICQKNYGYHFLEPFKENDVEVNLVD